MRQRILEEAAVLRHRDRLVVAGRYLLAILIGNLLWEAAQIPLYTIWRDGSPGQIAFAVIHCSGGDLLIASAACWGR
jgi:hypothetical protein